MAARVRTVLAEGHGAVRAAGSRVAATGTLRRGFHEASYALDATAMHGSEAPEVSSWKDLGALQFLLAVQDDEACASTPTACWGRSKAARANMAASCCAPWAFVEHNGQWERAAPAFLPPAHPAVQDQAGRATDRARPRRGARDRIEFWLA